MHSRKARMKRLALIVAGIGLLGWWGFLVRFGYTLGVVLDKALGPG